MYRNLSFKQLIIKNIINASLTRVVMYKQHNIYTVNTDMFSK